jgi:hypothetical protein
MKVVSCTRIATADGYSFIQAVVQFNNDENMQSVNENVRLHFAFLREPQLEDGAGNNNNDDTFGKDQEEEYGNKSTKTNSTRKCQKESLDTDTTKKRKLSNGSKANNSKIGEVINSDDVSISPNVSINNEFNPKTIITYKVEYSVDSGKLEKLFAVDIYAAGDFPSIQEAIPINEDNDVNSVQSSNDSSTGEKDQNIDVCKGLQPNNGGKEFEEIEMSTEEDQTNDSPPVYNDADRFGVVVDPENVLDFLEQMNMNLNEQSVFQFLLMFPFYEHEWDVSGFLLSSLFDEDDAEESDRSCT